MAVGLLLVDLMVPVRSKLLAPVVALLLTVSVLSRLKITLSPTLNWLFKLVTLTGAPNRLNVDGSPLKPCSKSTVPPLPRVIEDPPAVETVADVLALPDAGTVINKVPDGAVKMICEAPVALTNAPSPKAILLALTVSFAPLSIC
jgi:hypothetical protein